MVLLGKLSISALRNELQFLTSSNVGLFSGGRHLTAFVILQFLRIRSSLDEIDRFAFSSNAGATDWGNLSVARNAGAGSQY